MSHCHVETLLGRLATDPALRRRFAKDRGALLEEVRSHGYELTAIELEALASTEPDAIDNFAQSLDERLRKAEFTNNRRSNQEAVMSPATYVSRSVPVQVMSPQRLSYNPFVRGVYPVGVRTVTAIDRTRDGRELAIEIWYPATERYRNQDLDDATCDRFLSAPGQPEGLQHAVRDAEVSPGRDPLVLNSHAAASHRRDAALLGPHLASHGYVVAALDHPGDTIADIVTSHRASDEETVANRPRDAIFAINCVLGGAEPAIAAVIDATRLGMCGVFLGGWTTLRVNSLDCRIRAAFVAAPSWGLSGPFPQTKMQTAQIRLDDWAHPVPTFLVAGERDMLVILSDLRELFAKLPQPKRFAALRGASHFHWGEGAEQLYKSCQAMLESGAISVPGADISGLAKATPAFSELCPDWHGTETLQSLCLAQMDAELKGNAEAGAFLDVDLARAFGVRGIGLDEVASGIAVSV